MTMINLALNQSRLESNQKNNDSDVVLDNAILAPVKVGHWLDVSDWMMTEDGFYWQREGTIHVCMPYAKIFNTFLYSPHRHIRNLRNFKPYLVIYGTFKVKERVLAWTSDCFDDNCKCKGYRGQNFVIPSNDADIINVKNIMIESNLLEGFKYKPCVFCGEVKKEGRQIFFRHSFKIDGYKDFMPSGVFCYQCTSSRVWTVEELRKLPVGAVIQHPGLGIGTVEKLNVSAVEILGATFPNHRHTFESQAHPWDRPIQRLA